MKKWYVIHTEKGKEQTVDANLSAKRYITYCPMVYRDRRFLTTYATVQRPVEALFSCYLFIQMDDDGDWEGIKVMGEYVQIIRDGHTRYPQPIEDEIIELLKSRENSQGIHEVAAWRYREGDTVRVKRNVPEGMKGREFIIAAIEQELKERNITVEVEIFGRKQYLKVDESDIEQV